MYLLTFFYNTTYFSDHNLYIHLGLHSSWIDIGPVLDTDFVGIDTMDADIVQRSLCFDHTLYEEVKRGKYMLENTELGKKERTELQKEAAK